MRRPIFYGCFDFVRNDFVWDLHDVAEYDIRRIFGHGNGYHGHVSTHHLERSGHDFKIFGRAILDNGAIGMVDGWLFWRSSDGYSDNFIAIRLRIDDDVRSSL